MQISEQREEINLHFPRSGNNHFAEGKLSFGASRLSFCEADYHSPKAIIPPSEYLPL